MIERAAWIQSPKAILASKRIVFFKLNELCVRAAMAAFSSAFNIRGYKANPSNDGGKMDCRNRLCD
ncbi:hypothetical protein B6N13_07480 [Marinomonas sp. UCMA 3892]|nr:hypothetical protein [Marinomonas sp. UCMA 3892]